MTYLDERGKPKLVKIAFHALLIIAALSFLVSGWGTVKTGFVGVKLRGNRAVSVLGDGIYLKVPWLEKIEKMNIQTQKEQVEASAASKDLQTVNTVVAVNYNILRDKVLDLYQRVGVGYSIKVIDPVIQEVVKATTARYTAEELITRRAIVTDEIRASLEEKLALNDIHVSAVSIVNFDFSQSFNSAIESKVKAEQDALAAKNKLEQFKYEAEQVIAKARGEAESIRIQAEAITKQGGKDYLFLKWIEAWREGGAKVPQVLTDKNSNFLLDLEINK